MEIECIAPATGEVIETLVTDTPEDVLSAVARARSAQPAWAALGVRERARVLQRFRRLLVERGEELAQALSLECGKPRLEAYMAEVFTLVDLVDYFCKRAEGILADKEIPLHLMVQRTSTLHYHPRGVVGIISPWNFPLVIPFGDAVMALLAGNAVVLKPSEVTPLIARTGRELLVEAGVPEDLVGLVIGRGDIGAALCRADIDKMVFTGSVATGRKVAVACAQKLIPCSLELGGKAPAVVLPDANIERTARALVYGAFVNSGQACVSVERVYAHRDIHDRLVARVVELTRKLRQGDPQDGKVDVGAIIHAPQAEIAEAQVADATAGGATVAVGGHRLEGPGQFFEPTVLTGVRQQMKVMREETFGPLLPICSVDSVEQAIELANDTHLGLMAYVFSGSSRKGDAVARRLVAGTVMVNDVLNTYAMPETPWEGLKQSGLGRVHSDDGLRDMCQTRHLNVPWLPALSREPWWYPYSERTYRWMRRLIGLLYRW